MVFVQEADAQRITVIFEDDIFPSFVEAAAGREAGWKPAYSADFVKDGDEIICLC